jgi:hypothetical protein
MNLRTVVHLLSGARIESTWQVVTDKEYGDIRESTAMALSTPNMIFKCIEDDDPPSVEHEVYIPIRNIDTITIETTGDDDTAAAIS